MITLLALLTCIGAGVIGGVFFAFSTFVMRALGQVPAAEGARAMQRINVVVLNPWFLGAFMGTAALSLGCVVAAFLPWQTPRSILLAAGGALYFAGTFVVTIVFNVPRNERLARMDAATEQTQAYWAQYRREWTLWNHVRTAAAIGAALCLAAALAL